MGIIEFEKELRRYKKASFDTMVLIYFMEHNERYAPLAQSIIQKAEERRMQYCLSILIYMEVMAGFYKKADTLELVKVKSFFEQYPLLQYLTITREVADQAAKLRASYGFKPPDALILATAILNGAEVFITNDITIKTRCTLLPILYLEDYV